MAAIAGLAMLFAGARTIDEFAGQFLSWSAISASGALFILGRLRRTNWKWQALGTNSVTENIANFIIYLIIIYIYLFLTWISFAFFLAVIEYLRDPD
jgi:hypothetical protein